VGKGNLKRLSYLLVNDMGQILLGKLQKASGCQESIRFYKRPLNALWEDWERWDWKQENKQPW
jgi:hypothetical protein